MCILFELKLSALFVKVDTATNRQEKLVGGTGWLQLWVFLQDDVSFNYKKLEILKTREEKL